MAMVHFPRITHGYAVNYLMLNSTLAHCEAVLSDSMGSVLCTKGENASQLFGGVFNRVLLCTIQVGRPGEAALIYTLAPIIKPQTYYFLPVCVTKDDETIARGSAWLFNEKDKVESLTKGVYYKNTLSVSGDAGWYAFQCLLPWGKK